MTTLQKAFDLVCKSVAATYNGDPEEVKRYYLKLARLDNKKAVNQ